MLVALPADSNTVVKFQGDSILLLNGGWQKKMAVADLASFSHPQDLKSDLEVSLFTGKEDERRPVEGIAVFIKENGNQEAERIAEESGKDGIAIFPDLPVGFYDFEIDDERGVFAGEPSVRVLHGLKSTASIFLDETIFAPLLFCYSLEEAGKNRYDLLLSWEFPEEHLVLVEDYSYLVYLGSELIGETQCCEFVVPNLQPNDYIVTIVPISSYKNLHPEGVSMEVKISALLGLQQIDDACPSQLFHDINGMPVDQNRLQKGIYIRKNPSGSAEKILFP